MKEQIKERKDNSGELFNMLIGQFGLKNDAALCRKLGVPAPVVSKIRHGVLKINANLILATHEATGMSVAEIRGLIES